MANAALKKNDETKINAALNLLMDYIWLAIGAPVKYMFLALFFPMCCKPERGKKDLANPDSKASRYLSRSASKLRKELEEYADEYLRKAGVKIPKPLATVDTNLSKVCWLIRWVIRSAASPMCEFLLNPARINGSYPHKKRPENDSDSITPGKIDEIFNNKFLTDYLLALKEDRMLTDEEVRIFMEHVYSMRNWLKASMSGNVVAKADWPDELDQNFMDSHALMKEPLSPSDVIADLFTMLFVASLYGPRDYRWELGYLFKSDPQLVKTEENLNGFKTTAAKNGTPPTYPIITRVAYDEDSVDEQDYLICSDSHRLKGVREVYFGRMLRDETKNDTVWVSLVEPRLNEADQACVSKQHAAITLDDDGWVLRDWHSKYGTLVVTKTGDRHVVGGEQNERKLTVLQPGDVICFGYCFDEAGDGEPHANALLPCYLFNLGVDSWNLYDARTAKK